MSVIDKNVSIKYNIGQNLNKSNQYNIYKENKLLNILLESRNSY